MAADRLLRILALFEAAGPGPGQLCAVGVEAVGVAGGGVMLMSGDDLADPEVPRWLAFTPSAVAAGARAVFGFPLQVGTVRLGALNLYCDRCGPLSDDQHADALVMAGVAARRLRME